MATFDPTTAADVTFLPLADPERRDKDPLRALAAAHDLRILLGIGELAAVRNARRDGWSWADIGQCLAISRQAAQQRFSFLLDEPPSTGGCAHALYARNCPDPGGCPDARDALGLS